MSATLALASMLSLNSGQEVSSVRLAEAWRSYRYSEYHASGGYVCDHRRHRWITEKFQKRFGQRVATLKAAAGQQLEKSAFESEIIVVSVCENFRPDVSLPAWAMKNFKEFEGELAITEQAFGISRGAH